MYACIPEIGCGFFEGVCTLSNASAIFRDPPHTATQKDRSPIAKAPARSGTSGVLP